MTLQDKNDDQSRNEKAVSDRLSVGEKVGYGLGDTASNLFWKTFEFFLMYFYTDVFGISAKSAGTMMLITRLWDAINDPLFGYLADRTKTAWGRFRPYLLWLAVPFAISGAMTFYTPDLDPTGKLIYAYVSYTIVMMLYTAINIPYGALMGVISPNSLERTSVSTYRFVLAFIGGIIVQYGTLNMVEFFGGGTTEVIVGGIATEQIVDEAAGFFWTMVVFSVAAMLLFFICFATTKERVQPEPTQTSTLNADVKFVLTSTTLHQVVLVSVAVLSALASGFALEVCGWVAAVYIVLSLLLLVVRRWALSHYASVSQESSFQNDFHDLLKNRPWMALFGFGLLQLMGLFIRGGAILYYFKYYCQQADRASLFLVLGSVAAIFGMLLTKHLTAIFGKKTLMVLVNVLVAILTAAFVFLNPENIYWMFALHLCASFIGGPSPVLLWAMYADAADYSHWKNGRRATGLVFSAATFAQKMGCAVGAATVGFALDFFEYLPPIDGTDQPQSDYTLWGLCLMMSLIPAAFLFLGASCLAFYNISEPMLQKIEADLANRKANDT
jgi:GPH family glycoside/pentoside/hexuronide:cation symporter